MNIPSIAILMATYNGQAYLGEQLDSIIKQTYSNWTLFIRDDNSSDQTLSIIEEYRKADQRIQLIQNQTDYHGAYYNFFGLINDVRSMDEEYDFYLFADQDDVWDQDKLERLLHFYESRQAKGPALVYADMRIIDADGVVTSDSLDALMGIHYTNPISAYMAHKVYGCNTFFNQELFHMLPALSYGAPELAYLSHDNFTTKVAALRGEVYFYPETTMGYRRYGNNVTSKHEYHFTLKRILKRFAKADALAKDHALTYKQTLVLTDLLRHQELSADERSFLDQVDKIIHKGGFYAVLKVITEHIDWGKPIKTLSRTGILLSGIYKKYLKNDKEQE